MVGATVRCQARRVDIIYRRRPASVGWLFVAVFAGPCDVQKKTTSLTFDCDLLGMGIDPSIDWYQSGVICAIDRCFILEDHNVR